MATIGVAVARGSAVYDDEMTLEAREMIQASFGRAACTGREDSYNANVAVGSAGFSRCKPPSEPGG